VEIDGRVLTMKTQWSALVAKGNCQLSGSIVQDSTKAGRF